MHSSRWPTQMNSKVFGHFWSHCGFALARAPLTPHPNWSFACFLRFLLLFLWVPFMSLPVCVLSPAILLFLLSVCSFCFILVCLLDCFLEGGHGVGRVRWEGSEGGDWDIFYENNSFQETWVKIKEQKS